jgi:hypothetical protein
MIKNTLKKLTFVGLIASSSLFTGCLTDEETATPLTALEGGEIYNVSGAEKGSFDLDNNEALSSVTADTANRELVDLSVAGEGLSKSWEGKNGTKLAKANSYDYANATGVSLVEAASTVTWGSSVTSIAVGDIILASWANNIAAIKITEVDTTVGESTLGNTGVIRFEYKKTTATTEE